MPAHAKLHQLTYFSRSLIRGPRWFVDTEVERLLVVARERNAYFAVTGSLLFIDGCFAQIIEGPLESIEHIYAAIRIDHRHADVTLLNRRDIAGRDFADFSLQYIPDLPGTTSAGGLFGKLDRALRAAGP